MENAIIHGQYSSNVNKGSIVIKTKETIASSWSFEPMACLAKKL
jgi:hypothetical protein